MLNGAGSEHQTCALITRSEYLDSRGVCAARYSFFSLVLPTVAASGQWQFVCFENTFLIKIHNSRGSSSSNNNILDKSAANMLRGGNRSPVSSSAYQFSWSRNELRVLQWLKFEVNIEMWGNIHLHRVGPTVRWLHQDFDSILDKLAHYVRVKWRSSLPNWLILTTNR